MQLECSSPDDIFCQIDLFMAACVDGEFSGVSLGEGAECSTPSREICSLLQEICIDVGPQMTV